MQSVNVERSPLASPFLNDPTQASQRRLAQQTEAQTAQSVTPTDKFQASAELKMKLGTSAQPAAYSPPVQVVRASVEANRGAAASAEVAPAPSAAAAQAAAQTSFSQADVDSLVAIFGSASGDESFNNSYDFDGDGVIGLKDLNHVLANIGPESTDSGADALTLDGLLSSFGSSKGDDAFDTMYDADGDGAVTIADLNTLLPQVQGGNAGNTPSPADLIMQAFGASSGEANYIQAFDFDNDGTIGLSDVNTLLEALTEAEEQSENN